MSMNTRAASADRADVRSGSSFSRASTKLQAVPAHLPRVNVTIPGDFGRAVKFVAWTRSFVLAYS
jgi:hypothetical protein